MSPDRSQRHAATRETCAARIKGGARRHGEKELGAGLANGRGACAVSEVLSFEWHMVKSEMADEIRSRSGRVVGKWDGRDVRELREELIRIQGMLKAEGYNDRVRPDGIPHADQIGGSPPGFHRLPHLGM